MSGEPLPTDAPSHERLHYVDALRILAIVVVFLVHVCQVFDPWDAWHITNAERSRLIGSVDVVAAPWVMPLVMLLAGVSAWFSLRRRGNAEYIRERMRRLLVPLVIGTLVLVAPQVYLERVWRGQFTGSFIAFYPHFFEGVYPQGNLSWHHLWFLAHLFGYSMLALPLFRFLQQDRGRRVLRWAARVAGGPGGMLWLAVPLVLERNLLWGVFRERHMLTSDWSNHALLFVAYIYGFILAGSRWLGRMIDSQWMLALLFGGAGTSALIVAAWRGFLPNRLPAPYSLGYLTFWVLYSLCAWAWMVGLLGLGRRWLSRERKWTRYGGRVAYVVYIVHQPVIVGVAFLVVPTQAGIAAKFAVIFAASAVVTMVLTEAVIRIPVIRWAFGAGGGGTPVRAAT